MGVRSAWAAAETKTSRRRYWSAVAAVCAMAASASTSGGSKASARAETTTIAPSVSSSARTGRARAERASPPRSGIGHAVDPATSRINRGRSRASIPSARLDPPALCAERPAGSSVAIQLRRAESGSATASPAKLAEAAPAATRSSRAARSAIRPVPLMMETASRKASSLARLASAARRC